MSTETRRQVWYAQVFVYFPLALWLLDRYAGWFRESSTLAHWLIGLAGAVVVLALLRVTNPWEWGGEPRPTRPSAEPTGR